MRGKHAAGSPYTVHKKKPQHSKIIKIIVIIGAVLIILCVLGNLFPQKTNHGAPSQTQIVNVADVLRNNSPNWYVAQHIVAVVRADDGGKSVTLVNSGKGTASAIIPLSRLGIAAHHVMVWHVWTGIVSPAGALRVVLPAGTAMYLILK